MPLTVKDVQDIVIESIIPYEQEGSVYYIDLGIHSKGSTLVVGHNQYELKTDTIIVFIDDLPGMNWAHTCRYVLFDIHVGSFSILEEEFPPRHHQLVGEWKIIHKSDRVEDWQLVFPY